MRKEVSKPVFATRKKGKEKRAPWKIVQIEWTKDKKRKEKRRRKKLTYNVPCPHIKFRQAAAVRRDKRRRRRKGQTAASGALRVRLPTSMKKTAAAKIYGID